MNQASTELFSTSVLETQQQLAPTSLGFVSPDALTFLSTVVPLTLLALFTALTINSVMQKQNRRLIDIFGGLKVALIISAMPIGMALLLARTDFVTKAEKNPQPRNITISTSDHNIKLQWRTSSKSVGGFRLSPNSNMQPIEQTAATQEELLSHQYIITNIVPQTTYYLEILSDGAWYNNEGKAIEIKLP